MNRKLAIIVSIEKMEMRNSRLIESANHFNSAQGAVPKRSTANDAKSDKHGVLPLTGPNSKCRKMQKFHSFLQKGKTMLDFVSVV